MPMPRRLSPTTRGEPWQLSLRIAPYLAPNGNASQFDVIAAISCREQNSSRRCLSQDPNAAESAFLRHAVRRRERCIPRPAPPSAERRRPRGSSSG